MVARLKTQCVRAIFFSLALTLFGCSSSGSDDDSIPSVPGSQVGLNELGNGSGSSSNNITSETNPSNIDVTTFTTSLLQLNYPSDWTVDTSDSDIEAQFFSNKFNEFGGVNNCVLISDFAPGGSLLELTDVTLDLFATTPMPDVSFVTVNGTSMSRISGNLDQVPIQTDMQLAYEDSYIYAVLCFGLTPEELNVFFDSMNVF